METLGTLFAQAMELTPLAIIGMLVGILYVLLWKQPSQKQFETLESNHLSDLPVIARNTASMVEGIRRIENAQTKAFAELNAKLDMRR